FSQPRGACPMTKSPSRPALKRRRKSLAPERREWLSRHRRLVVEMLEDRRLLTATPQGNDFRVNQNVSGTQLLSGGNDAVALDALGNFVIAYAGPGANKTNDVLAQRFAAGGTLLGDPIHVNQYVAGSQDLAAVGASASGQFVVVWA